MQKSRTPLIIGWEAARANAKPALIIQAIMLALAVAFYTNSSVADALRNLAEFKRAEAHWLGDVVTLPVVLGKICIDQFGYNVFFAAPFGVLTYEWKNSGISMQPLRDLFTWPHYRDKIFPTLLATWAVWIPLMAIIYSLPLVLQFPLFSLALSFWVLLLTYMTNRFAGKIEADAPIALAVVTEGRPQITEP